MRQWRLIFTKLRQEEALNSLSKILSSLYMIDNWHSRTLD